MTIITYLTVPVIVICTEPGFEWKSRLLVRSIRKYSGRLKGAVIVSYSPRPGLIPSNECLDEFGSLNVQVVTEPLNQEFAAYGLANKIFALAHAEMAFPFRPLLFLDSDKVMLREPSALLGLCGSIFAARPVDIRLCGAVSLDCHDGAYWRAIHEACGVSRYRHVLTTIEREQIIEYYNSGMILAPASIGLFSSWLKNFIRVWHGGPRPWGGDFFVEQTVLAATVSAMCDDVFILPQTYNVPIHLFHGFPCLSLDDVLSQCVSLHYHDVFNREEFHDTLNSLSSGLDADRISWLANNLDELSRP